MWQLVRLIRTCFQRGFAEECIEACWKDDNAFQKEAHY